MAINAQGAVSYFVCVGFHPGGTGKCVSSAWRSEEGMETIALFGGAREGVATLDGSIPRIPRTLQS